MTHDEVFDMILDSAKSKFDHEVFLNEMMAKYGVTDKDIVFDAMTRYAGLQNEEALIEEMHGHMAAKNMVWPKEKIREFLSDKQELWKNEIIAMNNFYVADEPDPEKAWNKAKEILAYS